MEGEEGRGKETGGIGREGGCANGRRGREGEEGMEVNSKREWEEKVNRRKRNSKSNMNSSSNKRKRNSNSNMNSSSNRRKRRCYSVDIEGSE